MSIGLASKVLMLIAKAYCLAIGFLCLFLVDFLNSVRNLNLTHILNLFNGTHTH